MTHLEWAKQRSRVRAQCQFAVDRAHVRLKDAHDDMMECLRSHVAEVGADEAMEDSWASHWMLNGGDVDLQTKARGVLQRDRRREHDD